MKKDTHSIKAGKIVRFSKDIIDFCNDFSVTLMNEDQMKNSTFLVVEVSEENSEADVLSHDGAIITLGLSDLVIVEE